MKKIYKIIDCPKCNFTHISPIPSVKNRQEYYENKYYQSHSQPLLEFKKELHDQKWLDQQSEEHRLLLKKFGKSNGKVLDIGCGNGFFLHYMQSKGWNALGIEPNSFARKNADSLGVKTKSNFSGLKNSSFDVIMLRYTLEHIPNPSSMLKKIKKYLVKNGLLIVMVPNDFNPLQLSVEKMGYKQWWVSTPDHINYFNFKSLKKLLKKINYNVVYQTTDFPMELFLLLGNDYVNNSSIGKKYHKQRINFENNLDPKVLRKLYKSYAQNNMGRTCIIYAQNS